MKETTRKIMGSAGLALGLCLAAGVATARAQGTGAGRLDGTWDIVLTLRNCTTGGIGATFRELATFDRGGTMVSSTSAFSQATKTPGHGVWQHLAGQTYTYSFKFFRFDAATGAFLGWTVIRQEAVLDSSGDAYTAAGGASVYSKEGVEVASGCSTTEATRFQ
jgi:hypothetical protein